MQLQADLVGAAAVETTGADIDATDAKDAADAAEASVDAVATDAEAAEATDTDNAAATDAEDAAVVKDDDADCGTEHLRSTFPSCQVRPKVE